MGPDETNKEEVRDYILALQPGERVEETGQSGLKGHRGTIYINDKKDVCVRWDPFPGETGQMGSTVTWGTRRLSDIPNSRPDTPQPKKPMRPDIAHDRWTEKITRDLYNLAHHTGLTLDAENFSLQEEVEETPEGPGRRGRVAIITQETQSNPVTAWKENQWWTDLIQDLWYIHGTEPALGFLAIKEPQLDPAKK